MHHLPTNMHFLSYSTIGFLSPGSTVITEEIHKSGKLLCKDTEVELRHGRFPIPRGYINPIKSFAKLNLPPHSNLVSFSSFVASAKDRRVRRSFGIGSIAIARSPILKVINPDGDISGAPDYSGWSMANARL